MKSVSLQVNLESHAVKCVDFQLTDEDELEAELFVKGVLGLYISSFVHSIERKLKARLEEFLMEDLPRTRAAE